MGGNNWGWGVREGGCPEAIEGLGHVRRQSSGSRLERGRGQEGHPPCIPARGPGTPARSSRTAGGSASRSPCGRHLHGQKQNMSAALPEGRGEIRVSPLQARQCLPLAKITEVRSLAQRLESPSLQSPRQPKIRTSNELSLSVLNPF